MRVLDEGANTYNYSADIMIDPDALDVEWLGQPQLFMKYSIAAAGARREMDLCKERVEVKRAVVDKEIRSNPDVFGLSKVTEATVSAAVTVHPEYEKANAAYLVSRYEYDILSRAVQAFEQRKTALENLVRLQGQGYFAAPQEPRELGMEWAKKASTDVANSKIHMGMKRRV